MCNEQIWPNIPIGQILPLPKGWGEKRLLLPSWDQDMKRQESMFASILMCHRWLMCASLNKASRCPLSSLLTFRNHMCSCHGYTDLLECLLICMCVENLMQHLSSSSGNFRDTTECTRLNMLTVHVIVMYSMCVHHPTRYINVFQMTGAKI